LLIEFTLFVALKSLFLLTKFLFFVSFSCVLFFEMCHSMSQESHLCSSGHFTGPGAAVVEQSWDTWFSNGYLVGGLEHFLFFHILGISIPTDLYFSEGFKPPTRYVRY